MPATQPALLAYHGQPAIKDEYLSQMEAHRAAGDLVPDYAPRRAAGPGQEEARKWRGSAIDCLVHDKTDPYGAAEFQLGVPRVLARMLQVFFSDASLERQPTWPAQFLQAIPVGADLSGVGPQLAVWLLVAEPGVLRFAQTDQQREVIQAVADLYTNVLAGKEVTHKQWLAAYKTIHKMAISPAYSAASLALSAATDTPDFRSATNYDKAYAAATAAFHADLDLAHAFGNALAASNAVSTAYMLANHMTDSKKDTVCGAAAAAVSAATYAAALAETPVAVGAAAYYIADSSGYRARKDAYPYFVKDASRVYYDALADNLLALLAAAPVPARG